MVNQKKSQKPTINSGTKLKTFIKNDSRILLFTLFLFILNLIFLGIACAKNEIAFSSKSFFIVLIATVIINIILCVFIFFAKKKSWPLEKTFLIIGLVLGIMYLLIIPMGRAPDEPTHFWRVYNIAEGKILTTKQDNVNGNYLPQNIAGFGNNYDKNAYRILSEKLTEPISDEQVFQKTIGANPIDYLPQVVGISVGKILHLPMLITLYLGRLFGLIACIAIIYFCLKYIPILKKSLFFISCLPLTMQSFVSISYDGMIFCAAIALITFVLYFIYHPHKFKAIHYLALILISVILVAVKPVYFPICLLYFFIPTECFKNKKWKIFSIIAILFATVGLFLLWSLVSVITEPGNGADTGGQISFILSNPIKYIAILIRNSIDKPFLYIAGFGSLEWLDIHTNDFYIITTIIMFVLLCVEERFTFSFKDKLPKNMRWVTAILASATVFAIFSALYIQWSQVGSPDMEGIQTRYFLPVMVIIPLLCIPTISHSTDSHEKELLPYLYLCTFVIFLNLNALTTLLCAHI